MTEKIARRGVRTPHSYEPDALEKMNVDEAIKDAGFIICEDNSVEEMREWLTNESDRSNYFIIANSKGEYRGILSASTLFNHTLDPQTLVGSLVKRTNIFIKNDESLRTAVEMMAKENVDVLPVVFNGHKKIIGVLSYLDVIATYKERIDENENKKTHISLKRNGLKLLLHGQRIAYSMKPGRKE